MHMRSITTVWLMLLLAASISPAWAQDDTDDAEDDGSGKIHVELAIWATQPRGLDFFPATEGDPNAPLNTSLVKFDGGTESERRIRFGYRFGQNRGAVMVTWFKHDGGGAIVDRRPGEFVFGTTLTHPLFSGFSNDGFADAYDYQFSDELSDGRIDYSRTAVKNRRVIADWFVGVRRVKHSRFQAVNYFALDPGLPALLPPLTAPRPDLDPNTETAIMSSSFTGRGIEAGMDFKFPMLKGKVVFESGLAVAALRGKIGTDYTSLTHFYVFTDPDTGDVLNLTAPYDEFELFFQRTDGSIRPVVDFVTQESLTLGLTNQSLSTSSLVIETYLGVRWNIWRTLEVFLGFRNAQYSDVGLDLRPVGTSVTAGVNLGQLDSTRHSVTYEGFYGGLSYAF